MQRSHSEAGVQPFVAAGFNALNHS